MIIIYGYDDGSCDACENLKQLFQKSNMEYQFINVPKLVHCFKSVPQTFYIDKSYAGDYPMWRSILKK